MPAASAGRVHDLGEFDRPRRSEIVGRAQLLEPLQGRLVEHPRIEIRPERRDDPDAPGPHQWRREGRRSRVRSASLTAAREQFIELVDQQNQIAAHVAAITLALALARAATRASALRIGLTAAASAWRSTAASSAGVSRIPQPDLRQGRAAAFLLLRQIGLVLHQRGGERRERARRSCRPAASPRSARHPPPR